MASPYILHNIDLQVVNASGQDYQFYVAFLNPVAITTTWSDLNVDINNNWLPPPDVDTLVAGIQPYVPTANLGSNRIGFVNEPLYFDGTRSCQRWDLPVVSYSWSYSGMPTATQYHNGSQLGLSWSAPGLYTVSLTVKDRYGKFNTGTRQVMIYADRDSALPGVVSISGLAGSLASNGWQCQLTTVNSQVTLFPPDQLPIGSYQPIVVMCETQYEVIPDHWVNQTIGPHGSFSPGYPYQDPRIFFDGYIQNGSVHQDVDKDTLSFVCLGPQMILGEAKTHQVGYYSVGTKTWRSDGTPSTLKTSPAGHGFLVGGLQSCDVIHSLLQYHCSIGKYHDIHLWNTSFPASVFANDAGNTANYELTYTTIGTTEGTILQNISDVTSNEWGQVYCERDGSIRVGPQVNYRGSDYWQNPTLLGQAEANSLINFIQELGYTVGNDLDGMAGTIPTLPAQQMPIQFVHSWGHQLPPPQVWIPFGSVDPQVLTVQQQLKGPPIVCTFSDVPVYDPSPNPPGSGGGVFFPWVLANWPQDLAVYPVSFDFPQNYTGRTSLVKLIGTLVGHTTLWTSWWPQNAFSFVGSGTNALVVSTLPAGNWVVDQSHILPEVYNTQLQVLMNNWWWEMARRVYYASNISYTGTVTLGMFTACSLSDIVGITRQNNALGAHWNNKPFYVTDIAYNVDLAQKTWSTTIGVTEVTSIAMGPVTKPPKNLPKGYI